MKPKKEKLPTLETKKSNNESTFTPLSFAQSKTGKEIITAKGLHKSFFTGVGETTVLKGIDVSVKEGEFIIIFGPSGSGKSTLLHSLIGLEVPTKGNVNFYGQSLYDGNEDERSMFRLEHIGIMYQQPTWIKAMDVIHNVALPLNLMGMKHSEAMARAHEKLSNMAMDKWEKYKPTELSSGQQQKISMVRALVTDAQVIIADEPTGNLDIDSSKRLIEALKELNLAGKTIMIVTHDLQFLGYADRTFYINDGLLAGVYEQAETRKLIDDVVNKGKSIFNLSKDNAST